MRTLLIVDDDSHTRRSLRRTLSDSDLEVIEACSAAQALDILATREVHVVLTDFHLGATNGAELLSEIDLRYPQIVRILLTSDTATNVMVSAINNGRARRVVHKPWRNDQLRLVIEQAMASVRGAPPKKQPREVSTREPIGAKTARRLAAMLGIVSD